MLQANRSNAGRRLAQSASTGCGEEFRNCADIAVLGSSGMPAPTQAPMPTPSPSQPTPAPVPTSAPSPTPTQGACVRNPDCSVNAWCQHEGYDAWCAAQGAGGDCPAPQCTRASMPKPEPEAEPEPEGEPEPEAEPEPSTTQPSLTSSPPEMACFPTNSAYSLYCTEQSAVGSCPSPWCETRVVALQAGRTREVHSRRHSFLGTALIQDGVSLERGVFASTGKLDEL